MKDKLIKYIQFSICGGKYKNNCNILPVLPSKILSSLKYNQPKLKKYSILIFVFIIKLFKNLTSPTIYIIQNINTKIDQFILVLL